jgi:hypothetical protein
MAFAGLLRLVQTLSGLAAAGQQIRRVVSPPPPGDALSSTGIGGGLTGPLEARLAGVLVAALKEAFDRDRARLDLEQAQLDAERRRVEDAMRLELRRQSGDQAIAHGRLLVVLAMLAWLVSAVLLVLLPNAREMPARGVFALGWTLLLGCVGTAFAFYSQVTAWLGALRPGAPDPGDVPAGGMGRISGGLLIAGIAAVAAALLLAL